MCRSIRDCAFLLMPTNTAIPVSASSDPTAMWSMLRTLPTRRRLTLGFEGKSMLALIEAGPQGLAEVRELAAADVHTGLKLGDVRLCHRSPD